MAEEEEEAASPMPMMPSSNEQDQDQDQDQGQESQGDDDDKGGGKKCSNSLRVPITLDRFDWDVVAPLDVLRRLLLHPGNKIDIHDIQDAYDTCDTGREVQKQQEEEEENNRTRADDDGNGDTKKKRPPSSVEDGREKQKKRKRNNGDEMDPASPKQSPPATTTTTTTALRPAEEEEEEEAGVETTTTTNEAVSADSSTSARRMTTTTCNITSQKKDSEETNTTTTSSATTTNSTPAICRTRHVAIQVYYDGGNYTGLAETVGSGDNDKSVERQLFKALQKSCLLPGEYRDLSCKYSRCGRTDKGVSAHGQVLAMYLKSNFAPDATLGQYPDDDDPLTNDELPKNAYDKMTIWQYPKKQKTSKKKTQQQQSTGSSNCSNNELLVLKKKVEKTLSEYDYAKILNNLLPSDIRILGWKPVTSQFSARFSAKSRTYRYFFLASDNGNTRGNRLNIDKMKSALKQMIGKHDFRNFCKLNVEQVSNYERQIYNAEIIQVDDTNVSYIQIVGQAFLWHQIRCIAQVLLYIGRGYEKVSVVTELLNVDKYQGGKPSYDYADEQHLVLHDCVYDNLSHFSYSATNLWKVHMELYEQWRNLILHAARIQNTLTTLEDTAMVDASDLADFGISKWTFRQNKKKRRKRTSKQQPATAATTATEEEKQPSTPTCPFVSDDENSMTVCWKEALAWLSEIGLCISDRDGDLLHIPLLQRSRGTTYEEKVANLNNKRRAKYETNIVKKQKTETEEDDQAFYERMTKQGGL